MRKRVWAMVLAVAMVLSLMVVPVSAAEVVDSGTCGDDLTWVLTEDGTLTISGTGEMYDYSRLSTNLSPWYSRRSLITSIILDDGVTSIGAHAFSWCTNLTSVTMPDELTSIGCYAFYDCTGLAYITIGEGVTSIGECAFDSCTGLSEVTIGSNVADIGDSAFWGCSSLVSITIPDNVTSIDSAFPYCTNLTYVYIGSGVTSIGYEIFVGCSNLDEVQISEENKTYKLIDGVLFSKDMTTLVYYDFTNNKTDESYDIPDSVTSIGDYAFYDCGSLTSIIIPDSVTSIGEYAFDSCYGLTSVTIGRGITDISESAFSFCDNLIDVTIPNSVTSIGDYAFYYCTNLTYVYYEGSENGWENISIGIANPRLTGATIYYGNVDLETDTDEESSENTNTEIWDGTIADIYAGGDGSEDNPYQISTAEQLAKLANDSDKSKYYVLVNDIYLNDSDSGYTNEWTSITSFKGSFDGQGYCVYGLYGGSLFGNSTGTIQNVRVSDSYITSGYGASPLYVGAIAGNASYISGCSTSSTVTISVSSTSSSVQVIYAGGIAGSATTVDQCFNEATVSASGTYMVGAGGIIGQSNGGEITNCYNIGSIASTSSYGSGYSYCGGIVGCANMTSPSISCCYNTASIGKTTYHGGIIGLTTSKYAPTLTNCYTLSDSNNLVGYATSSYYGSYTSVGCAKLSEIEMKSEDSYEGFDFDSIWMFASGENDGYPILQWSYSVESDGDTDTEKLTMISEIDVSKYDEDQGAYTDTYDSLDIGDKLLLSVEVTVDEDSTPVFDVSDWECDDEDVLALGELSVVGPQTSEDYDGMVVYYISITADVIGKGTSTVTFTAPNNREVSVDIKVGDDEAVDSTLYSAAEDGWCIGNIAVSFGYDDDYSIGLSAYYATDISALDIILSKVTGSKWGGNCFGLSLLSIAEYTGQVDLSSYFDSEGDTLNTYGYESIADVSGVIYNNNMMILNGSAYVLAGNEAVISIIENAQVSQFSKEIEEIEVGKLDSDYSTAIQYMCNNEIPLLITLTFGEHSGGHAVVVDLSQDYIKDDKGWYYFYVYDCNAPSLTNELENGAFWYHRAQSMLCLNPDTGEWVFYEDTNSDGELEEYDRNNYYAVSLPIDSTIHFYDVSQLDSSFFYGTGTLHLIDDITMIESPGILTIYNSTGEAVVSIADGEVVSCAEDTNLKVYAETIEDSGTPTYYGTLESGQYTYVTDGEASILRSCGEEYLYAFYVDGASEISVDDESQTITLVNTGSDDVEFIVALQDTDGVDIESAEGVLESGGEFTIQLEESDTDLAFEDVKESDYFYNAVLWAVENGITEGTSETTFSPFLTAERCQVVTFLWRAAGCPEPTSTENPFTDVDEDDYFYNAVLWAVEKGITTGTSATTFSPYNKCERCQVVTFLYRYFGQPEVTNTSNPFTDVDTDDYFYNAVLWAVDNGITTGTSDTTFGPFVTCERCMVVTFLYRADQL